MVPVPEEMAEDVARYLQWHVRKPEAPALDEPTFARALRTLDEPCRTLISVVADGVVNGSEATVSHLAAVLRCSAREVSGTALEANHRMREAGAPVIMMATKPPGAATDVYNERILLMTEDAAAAVVAAERLAADEEQRPGT